MSLILSGSDGLSDIDGSASTPAIRGTDANTGIFFPAADTIAFSEGGAEAMRIASTGFVGIGVSSPAVKLDISNASSTAYNPATAAFNTILGISNLTSGASNNAIMSFTTESNGEWYIGGVQNSGNTAADFIFASRASGARAERARITSAGYFKASNNGTYTGSTGNFHEFNSTANGSNVEFRSTSASLSSGGMFFISADRNTTNNTFYYVGIYNYGSSSYRLQIADSGNVTNTNGSYGTISDVKLKQDIVDATPQWNDIKNLRFRKYRLKSEVELDPNAKPFLGLVAQEAELVCPGLIEEHIDRDREDNDLGTTTKSIKTSVLYMKAVKALQEAMDRIETLEAQNAAFEARLAALEAK
jgi:hypothetical protein